MLDDITMAVATAVATRATEALVSAGHTAVTRLVRLVRDRLRIDRAGLDPFDAARAEPTDDARVRALGEALDRVTRSDPAFAAQLRALWDDARTELSADHGGVVNQISGNVGGHVVQARDIRGGVTFG